MLTRLLLLCLTGHVFAKERPEVNCLVVHLKYVKCSWIKDKVPDVNYTFYSRFKNEKEIKCTKYVIENSTNTGCHQPYDYLTRRFETFHTRLVHGKKNFEMSHELKQRVLLYPPVNVTVKNESNTNLWFYWNQTSQNCVESEVRFRTNNKKWETSLVKTGRQSYCINLPSRSSRYELQVRSRIGEVCGVSHFWSDWCEPVVWGSNYSSTDTNPTSVSGWTPLFYSLGAVILILLAGTLLYHERLRIIPIPVVPKPSLVHYDIEDWLQFSKGLKGNFKANYNEYACPVREYSHVSQSDSVSSDDSTCSVSTDQTDFSVSMDVNKSENLSNPCSSSPSSSSSPSAALVSSQEEQQVSV